MSQSRKIFSLSIFAFLVGNTTVRADDTYPAILGNGYDSLRLEHLPHQCMKGEVKHIISSSANVSFNKVEQWSRLNSQLNFHIPGSIFLKSDTELGKFVLRAKDSSKTSTYLLNSKVTTSKEILADPEEYNPLLPDEELRERCGTQYVTLIEKGGELYVGVKFSFSSEEQKEKFEGGGSITSIAGLGAHIKTLNEDIKKHSSVEIFFHQVGGNITHLNNMFESKDIASCSLENFEPCEHLMQDIWRYGTDQFVKAVKDDGTAQNVSFRTSDYRHRPHIFEDPKVIRGRKYILDSLDKHYRDRDYIDGLKMSLEKFEDCDGHCLTEMSSHISSNIRDLKESVRMSFLEPQQFVVYGTIDQLDLYKYEFPKKIIVPHSNIRQYARLLTAGLGVGILVPILWKQFHQAAPNQG